MCPKDLKKEILSGEFAQALQIASVLLCLEEME